MYQDVRRITLVEALNMDCAILSILPSRRKKARCISWLRWAARNRLAPAFPQPSSANAYRSLHSSHFNDTSSTHRSQHLHHALNSLKITYNSSFSPSSRPAHAGHRPPSHSVAVAATAKLMAGHEWTVHLDQCHVDRPLALHHSLNLPESRNYHPRILCFRFSDEP
jgi:hypothetical protein